MTTATTNRPETLELIAIDGQDLLANDKGYAWRVRNGGWRRACEGETSRDGLWVVGGGQWREGC
jgi:hypothetical protein